ncbi:MAG: hypothetical protein ACJ77A_06765 [Actinomycetota bacterium]
MRPRLQVLALVLALSSSLASASPAAAGRDRTPPPAGRGVADFNGDGHADLAIAAAEETVSGAASAGAVHVLDGSSTGLTSTGSRRLTGNTPSVPGSAASGDLFGGALAVGDFDDDGFSDLAVGVPGRDGASFDEGAVVVLYGSAAGLSGAGSQRFSAADVGAPPGGGYQLGTALTAGDFDRDGADDLAIGIPGQEVGSQTSAGAVGVLYGNAGTGLAGASSQLVTEGDLPGGHPHQDARFGSALVAADFGLGGEDDLVVGAPLDTDGSTLAGSASIVYGSAAGLDAGTGTIFRSSALPGSNPGDTSSFGSAFAWGRLGGNALADLVVGAPGERAGGRNRAGAVYLLLGRDAGVTAAGARRITESSAGVPSVAERDEFFGTALAAGNFGGTTADDLAVSAPAEMVAGIEEAGAVFVVPGSASGPNTANTERFTLDTPGVPGRVQDEGFFGEGALAAGNFGRGGRADLAVASRFETVVGKSQAGAVRALYGTAGGLTGNRAQRWTAASKGIAGNPGPSFFFGYSLA